MAFKMNYSPNKKTGKGFPYKTHLKAHEERHDKTEEKEVDDNFNLYESFILLKDDNMQFDDSGQPILDIKDKAYYQTREKIPYNPDINYKRAKWKK